MLFAYLSDTNTKFTGIKEALAFHDKEFKQALNLIQIISMLLLSPKNHWFIILFISMQHLKTKFTAIKEVL